MIIIGVDFHPEFQQIASVDTDSGELQEKRLAHREYAETFYRALKGQKVRVGMEASGHARWFERLVAELQFELRTGDAAEIRTKRVRKQEVEKWTEAQRLKTHPGVGALTALAFVLIIGRAERFGSGKQVASYLGLVPLEESSGNRRRLGHITKQGSSMLRFLLVEAAQVTVRSVPEWRSKYLHLMMRRGRKTAKVAMARRLAVRLYWMMRKEWDYEQLKKFGSHAGQLGNRDGVKQNIE